ncbi:MAG TPA: hypothetical protein VH374_21105 [Polyangia bacterium]|jgi:predicted esterase|nr:hypothetical protein [Polyangia bacterium]
MARPKLGVFLFGVVVAAGGCSVDSTGTTTKADTGQPSTLMPDGGRPETSAPETISDASVTDFAGAETAANDVAGGSDLPDIVADVSAGETAVPDGTVDRGGSTDGPGPGDLPTPTGACPEFKSGDVTFQPAGGARQVTITMGDAAKTVHGPLIFYWYATGSSVSEAGRGLPLPAITAAGGIVVAPQDVPNAGTFPWLQNLTQHDALFDEVVACAVKNTLIDSRRIHAVGFSAGALMTTHLSYARSGLLASVAAYSGGATGQFQEQNNKFAALIFTGGPSDIVVQNFFQSSQQWQATLKGAGHFTLFCNHMGGHSIPTRLVPGVWQFFQDHPYGTVPSPYAGGHTPGSLAPPCVE